MLVAALGVQIAGLALFVWYYKSSSIWKVGFIFLLAAFVFHIVTEILGRLSQSVWVSRSTVSPSAVDNWLAVTAAATLIFCLMHIASDAMVSKRVSNRVTETFWHGHPIYLPWKTFVTIGAATLFIAMSGDLWDPVAYATDPLLVYVGIGLARDLVWIAPALAGVSIVWVLAGRWYFLTLAGLLTATFLIGSRSIVIASGVLFVYGCSWAGVRIGWTRLLASVLAILIMAGSVSLLRVSVGREALVQASGPISRIGLIVQALSPRESTPPSATPPSATPPSATPPSATPPSRPLDVPEPVGQRVDGNSIGAAIADRQAQGTPALGATSALLELRLAVPNLLYPAKLATPVEERGAKALIRSHYQLATPPFPADVLVTQPGAVLAYGGIAGLWAGAALLGIGVGILDVLIRGRRTAFPILMGLGGLICALAYEQTLYVYGTVARSIAILAAVYAVAMLLNRRGDRSPSL